MQIAKNKVVAIDYTLTDTAGETIDSSKGSDPLLYLHGAGNIIPGLERALESKSAGDEVKAVIAPKDGYGEKNPQLVQPVPRTQFPGIKDIQPGRHFEAQTSQGPRVVIVVAVDDENITVDANHPLAGQTLTFDVKIVSVRDATAPEIEHGHAHGPDGTLHH